MVDFYDYSQAYTIYDEFEQKEYTISSLSYIPNFSKFSQYYKKHTITQEEQYRPDKIIFNLIGLQHLDWILDCINNFTTLEDYYIGREIFYLDINGLKKVGIII